MKMTETRHSFDQSKAEAALGYLIEKTSESMYPLLKMLYLADRIHLVRYGRYIAGDDYCAMAQGPVPSYAYDMLKALRGDGRTNLNIDVARAHERFRFVGENRFELVSPPDIGELSRSDVDALADVVKTYRAYGSRHIRDLSHDNAWKQAWQSPSRASLSVPMPLAFVANATAGGDWVEYALQDTAPGEAELPSGFVFPRARH